MPPIIDLDIIADMDRMNGAFAVGCKNWLFADTLAGTQASANLYSLIETAKANDVVPYGYPVELFKKLPTAQTADEFEALLPWMLPVPTASAA